MAYEKLNGLCLIFNFPIVSEQLSKLRKVAIRFSLTSKVMYFKMFAAPTT